MNMSSVKFRRAKETSFLIIDQDMFDLLSPFALKVYGQLRKLVSFNKECDETEITVKNLANLSGISERKTYDILNELEFKHYVIKRTNINHFRHGKTNAFSVSQTYNYFNNDKDLNTTAPNAEAVDNIEQNLSPTAPNAEGTAYYAEGTAPNADLKKQEFSQEVFKKKQNKGDFKTPVFVFLDILAVKTHIETIISQRQVFVEDDVIDQICCYSFEQNINKNYDSIMKRVNIALKKVREGEWQIPHGYKNITSKSIREKEEAQEAQKQIEIENDAKLKRALYKTVVSGSGSSSGWNAIVKSLGGKSAYA